jgi:hypothetical protein
VLTVRADVVKVEAALVAGALACSGCGGVLRPWGWARRRVLRGGSSAVAVRPRRALCAGCGVSHVLLPVFVLARRADLAEVIGAALVAKAAGAGARRIAAGLGRAVETVRGWLRRFAVKAEVMRAFFTRLLVDVGVDPLPPAPSGSSLADALSALLGARAAAAGRWPGVGEVSVWHWAAAVSHARLLAPSWP